MGARKPTSAQSLQRLEIYDRHYLVKIQRISGKGGKRAPACRFLSPVGRWRRDRSRYNRKHVDGLKRGINVEEQDPWIRQQEK